MSTAYLLLGSNSGNRLEYLNSAKALIRERVGQIEQESSIYETEAWGFTSIIPFLNQAIKVNTNLPAEDTLKELLKIEMELGRVRQENRYSSREIDVDILLYDKEVIQNKDLEIPHPRLHLRQFALLPLSEIGGSVEHPVFKKEINALLHHCSDKSKVELFPEN